MACNFSTFANIKSRKTFISRNLRWKYLYDSAGDAAAFRNAISLHQMGIDLSNRQSNRTCWSFSAAIIFVCFNPKMKKEMKGKKGKKEKKRKKEEKRKKSSFSASIMSIHRSLWAAITMKSTYFDFAVKINLLLHSQVSASPCIIAICTLSCHSISHFSPLILFAAHN